MNRCNMMEQAIRMSNAHSLAILVGVVSDFPRYLCNFQIPQADMTLNCLCQATLNPKNSSWEYLEGYLNFHAAPLPPWDAESFHTGQPSASSSPLARASWEVWLASSLLIQGTYLLTSLQHVEDGGPQSQCFSACATRWAGPGGVGETPQPCDWTSHPTTPWWICWGQARSATHPQVCLLAGAECWIPCWSFSASIRPLT